jgi:hypothetical protein
LNPTTLNWAQNQALRGGMTPVDIAVTSSNPAVGAITASPVTIGPGVSTASTAFDPLTVGSTILSVSVPDGFSTPGTFRQVTATVGTPTITIGSAVVGKELQTLISVTLETVPPSPIDITIQSDAIGTVTLTQNGTLDGSGTITLTNVSSLNAGSFFVQGRALGTATLTAQATGYNSGTSTVTVNPSGFIINSPASITTTTGAVNTNVQVTPARLDPITLNWSANQALRGGLSVNVPVESSNTAVGTITISPVVVGTGAANGTTAFDPQSIGVSTISVGTPPGFSQPSNFRQITATVNQ